MTMLPALPATVTIYRDETVTRRQSVTVAVDALSETERAAVVAYLAEEAAEGVVLGSVAWDAEAIIFDGHHDVHEELVNVIETDLARVISNDGDAEADQGNAEDASRPCAACGDCVATLSSRDRCDACEAE